MIYPYMNDAPGEDAMPNTLQSNKGDLFGIKAVTRLYNKELCDALDAARISLKEFAEIINEKYTTILEIRRLKCYPSTALREKFILFFSRRGVDFDDTAAFPEELRLVCIPTPHTYTIYKEPARLSDLSPQDKQRLITTNDTFPEIRLQENISKVLASLTDRERSVVCLRYGLKGKAPHTLAEIGSLYSVTKERILQILAMALRKLRHASRAKYLIPFTSEETQRIFS